jgi:hypothetical protein
VKLHEFYDILHAATDLVKTTIKEQHLYDPKCWSVLFQNLWPVQPRSPSDVTCPLRAVLDPRTHQIGGARRACDPPLLPRADQTLLCPPLALPRLLGINRLAPRITRCSPFSHMRRTVCAQSLRPWTAHSAAPGAGQIRQRNVVDRLSPVRGFRQDPFGRERRGVFPVD